MGNIHEKISLTEKEKQVLNIYLCTGANSANIGKKLDIGRRTVDLHFRNILAKFKAAGYADYLDRRALYLLLHKEGYLWLNSKSANRIMDIHKCEHSLDIEDAITVRVVKLDNGVWYLHSVIECESVNMHDIYIPIKVCPFCSESPGE